MLASRAALAVAMVIPAALVAALLSRLVRSFVQAHDVRMAAREDLPDRHADKAGTPSFGGVALGLTFALVAVAAVMPGALGGGRRIVAAVIALALAYGLIGFVDDCVKTTNPKARGLRARGRLTLEVLLALGFAYTLYVERGTGHMHLLPWARAGGLPWGWYSWPLAVVTIVGAANALNLTDGLDGLAAGNALLCALALAAGAMVIQQFAVAAAAVALAGACLGFLWFNVHPAQLFMGDTGSLLLGAALGGLAVSVGFEFILALAGIVFVWEALSVIIQVCYFRVTGGKRIFKMSPYHHHLELSGWPETRIVSRSWLISGLAGVAAWCLVLCQAAPPVS